MSYLRASNETLGMKKALYTLVLASTLVACSNNGDQTSSKDSLALAFATDPAMVDGMDGNPIIAIREDAQSNADESYELNVETVEQFTSDVRTFSSCVVIVEDHTIVRVENSEDCTNSGSWGTCMPMAEGFVRRDGYMLPQDDYINNIIGKPDESLRTVFLFK